MNKIGLALSGGGFRATLYHLGLVRFLRDAGILPRVTQITSVSGGSIFAAHLALNWDRYNGSPHDFDMAAAELLAFVRLDVRNRIVRRFPLLIPVRWLRRLVGLSNRKLSRIGLLEYHYEKYLFGDTSLFELPEQPQLHILATNLSEGCLCSFNRNGLLMLRREGEHSFHLDHVHVGLATVPMAVTASSAFPGFFPPLELTAADVGARSGEFDRQAYTDGGVFDSLGVRMFGSLARSSLLASPLSREDFFDFHAVAEALAGASASGEETPLRRLAAVLVAQSAGSGLPRLASGGSSSQVLPPVFGMSTPLTLPSPPNAGGRGLGEGGTSTSNGEEPLVASLWNAMRHHPFQREPLFTPLRPVDPAAEALLHASRDGSQTLDAETQAWLNRHLLEAAFRDATGQACFRRLNSALDCVLVSDVGQPIQVQSNRRAGGLIRTAMRSTDILMDRVWQLEIETFQDTPGFVFAPITDVVEPAEDETTLHPELQRQTAAIRTDLDRFSPLEISSLVRHGYCVGRKACRSHPDLFGAELPGNVPWDPIPGSRATSHPTPGPASSSYFPSVARPQASANAWPGETTVEARTLQKSAIRRIWSTLLDYRDWVSYVYVPIIIPLLFLVPYGVTKYYRRSHRDNQLHESFSQGSRDLETMSDLMENKSVPWAGAAAEEVNQIDEPDMKGFAILQDSRIIDLRQWNPTGSGPTDPNSLVYYFRRLKVYKLPENTSNNWFRLRLYSTSPKTAVRFPPQQLPTALRSCNLENASAAQKDRHMEVSFDFKRVPAGEFAEVLFDYHSPGLFMRRGERSSSFSWTPEAECAELTTWILMPERQDYRDWRIVRHKTDEPGKLEPFKPVTEYLADDFSILAFKLVGLKHGYTYEVTWYYKR
jgi:predicted acylesterase/phospholipase RssA